MSCVCHSILSESLSCCAAYLSDVIKWYIWMPQLLKYIHLRHSVRVDYWLKVSPAVSQYILGKKNHGNFLRV
jgi:hypothetical protein